MSEPAPDPDTPQAVRDYMAKIGSKGAKTVNKQLRGTETASERARRNVQVRWDKYYADHPEKKRPTT